MHKRHDNPCICGARHWRVSDTAEGGYWLETCQVCGATRQQPTRMGEASPHRRYSAPKAHAPARGSYIALRPAEIAKVW